MPEYGFGSHCTDLLQANWDPPQAMNIGVNGARRQVGELRFVVAKAEHLVGIGQKRSGKGEADVHFSCIDEVARGTVSQAELS